MCVTVTVSPIPNMAEGPCQQYKQIFTNPTQWLSLELGIFTKLNISCNTTLYLVSILCAVKINQLGLLTCFVLFQVCPYTILRPLICSENFKLFTKGKKCIFKSCLDRVWTSSKSSVLSLYIFICIWGNTVIHEQRLHRCYGDNYFIYMIQGYSWTGWNTYISGTATLVAIPSPLDPV